jgi:hypothetical protein
MESAPNLPGAGAVSQEGAKQQQLPFVSEQLAAAEAPLIALQRLYQQDSELSVQPLRHPRMMQLLLSGACWAGRSWELLTSRMHVPSCHAHKLVCTQCSCVRKQVAPPLLLARRPMLHNACLLAGMYVASDVKPSPMSQQICSMHELCIRLLALAVAGRAQQGHLQLQPPQDGQQRQDGQQQQQDGQQQRRSLSPEVWVHVGVQAVAEQLQKSLELAKLLAGGKLTPKDLDAATQVSALVHLWTQVCWQWT